MPVHYGADGLDRYSLDRGIDSISRSVRPDAPLPDAAPLAPAAQPSRPELDRLLWRPNLQDYVAGQLQPEVPDRELLMPQRFEQAMHAAAQRLRALSSGQSNRAAAAAVSKAARALAEEANLRDLLSMYRSTLYQG